MGPANLPKPSVDVEYDVRRARARKHFADAHAARRFYASKLRAGKNPRVVKGGDA